MKISSILSSGLQAGHSKKINKHIVIVGSANHRLNAMAPSSRLSIAAVLRKRYTKVGITVVNNVDDLDALIAKKPDLVVLGMKLILLEPEKSYDDSKKIWLASYLEEHGIAYTGSDSIALGLEVDKHDAKLTAITAGLRSSAFFISTMSSPTFRHNLQFPLFVKPTNRRASKGIDEQSVVYSDADLRAKIQSIHRVCSSDALIEEYLPGREFSVAVIRQQSSGRLLAMPIELTTPADKNGHSILSQSVKNADSETVLPVHDTKLQRSLSALAIGVFEALGARDYGRIDMRLDRHGKPSFIEANLMPGLSAHGYLSRCFYLHQGIPYPDMILAIAELGLRQRHNVPRSALHKEDSTGFLEVELASLRTRNQQLQRND
jgi:D-alanine-D-alanine ligase